MNWSDIWILYRRELRSAFRERTIVVNSILMPVFLYPVMLWVMFTGIVFVQGLAEGFTSRIAVSGTPDRHAAIVDSLRADDNVEIEAFVSPDSTVALIRKGELDAWLEFTGPEGEAAGLEGNFGGRVHYDGAVERSRRARSRIEGAVERYRARWLEEEAVAYGIPAEEREQFRVAGENVSTEEDMGALLLGQMIPLFLVIMVALGCFVPSVDTTAGERERSTWETSMTVSASRMSMVTAKYLYVATLGIMAGLLNVVAIFVSIGAIMEPLVGQAGAGEAFSFTLPLMAIPVMAVGAVGLALFFAAAMMILAAFARSFKEGQAMVTPVYWLALIPLILGQQTDVTLSPTLAAIPIANVAMMIRDAINGVFLWPLIAETLAVLLVVVVLCLGLARFILRFEDFLLGSYDGSFWRFARERIMGKKDEAARKAEVGVK